MKKNLQHMSHSTIKPLFTIALLCIGWILHAQKTQLTVRGEGLTLTKSAVVSVNGNLVAKKKVSQVGSETRYTDAVIMNSGNLFVTDSILNSTHELFSGTSNPYLTNSMTKLTSAGTITFDGKSMQPIICKDTILFHNIDITNTKGVKLNDTVCVLGKVSTISGSLLLNGKNLELFYDRTKFVKYDGRLDTEKNDLKVWDTTRINYTLLTKRSGHIITKYQDYNTLNASNLGITNSVNIGGIKSIERGHLPIGFAANGSIRKYFIVTTKKDDVGFIGSLEMSYLDSSDYANLHIKEPSFSAFINQNNSPVMFKPALPSTSDITNNKVSGYTVLSKDNAYVLTIADSICSDPPKANISVNSTVCQGVPFQVTINNLQQTSSQTIYYKWYRNGTLIDTSKIFSDTINTPGTLNYKLKISDNRGCFSYSLASVKSSPFPKAYFKTDKTGYCEGASTIFTDTSKISDNSKTLTSYWSFDDADTSTLKKITHTYKDTGTYHVKLISTSSDGCKDTIAKSVAIHPLPVAHFLSSTLCGDSSLYARFINTSEPGDKNKGITLSKWVFGTTDIISDSINPMRTIKNLYTTTGLKKISLSVRNTYGCFASYKDSVILSKQNIGFTASNVCLGQTISFTNSSTAESGSPVYTWDFGDDSTSNKINPQKTYIKTGSYDVTLYMQNGSCTDSLTKTVMVKPKPKISILSGNACEGESVDFSVYLEPSYPGEKLNSYNWVMDGISTSFANPSHSFSSYGTFPISLTVVNDVGCSATANDDIEIYQKPHANFTFENKCFGKTVNFYNQSTLSGGRLSYRWRFVDKDTSTNPNPDYVFKDLTGNKNVRLIAFSSNNGCSDTIVKVVEVYPLPANRLASPISTCGSSYLLDATVINLGMTANYTWLKDGSHNPIFNAKKDGQYIVDITSNHGCYTSDTVELALNSQVNPHLPVNPAYCGLGILDARYSGATYSWYPSGNQRTLTVTQTGLYKVTVTDQNNCTGKDSTFVTVYSLPHVSLGNNVTECSGKSVVLNAGTGFSNYQWSTGENKSSIAVTTQDNYKVTVTDLHQCQDTSSVSVTFLPVPRKPLANQLITGCKYAIINAGTNAASFLWNTGETANTITATNSGNYWVKVSNGNQCFIYDTVQVNILPIDDVNLGNDISVCEGQQVTLNAGQHGQEYSYIWNRQSTSSSIYNVKIGGRYIVELLNRNDGCSARDTVNVQFIPAPRINLGSDRSLCNSNSLTLDAGNPGSVIQWGSSNGLVSTQQTIDITGAGKYWVTVVNESGCISFDTLQIYPSSGEIIAEFIFDSEVYEGDTVHFCNMSYPTPYSSNWQFGDASQSTIENPPHVFYYPGTFNVTLTVSNQYCSYIVTEPIVVQQQLLKKRKIGNNTYGAFVEIMSSKVYPNPNRGEFTLELKLSDYADILVAVYDLKGGMVSVQKFKNVMELTNGYDLRRLSPGVYILKAMVGNKNSASYKIVKY
jgi:PKD repeat protein